MKPKNFEYVLALATKPAGKPSILDWCPFDKVTLDTIINTHNQRQVEFYQKQGWPINFVEEYGQFITVANYDLSDVNAINLAEFPKIRFVFANLPELRTAMSAIAQVQAAMNQARRVYYLAQISRKPPQASERQRFIPSPVLASDPEVIDDQATLERWLDHVSGDYMSAITAIVQPPPPPGDPSGARGGTSITGDSSASGASTSESKAASWTRLFMDYSPLTGDKSVRLERSPVEIASEVRDTAIERGLDESEIIALARKAALQDAVLSYVRASVLDHLGLQGRNDLVLDCLRKPMFEIGTNDEYAETTPKIQLMAVKLTQPFAALSKAQSVLCSGLRLEDRNRHVLLRSTPDTLTKIQGLGSIVESRHADLTLPFDASELLL